jgi:hypothetical protein
VAQVRRRSLLVLVATVIATVIATAVAHAVAAQAASLDGLQVTLQFKGHLHTDWSFPGTETGDDGCYVETTSGSGSQTMDFDMHGNRATMGIVDAGGSLSFQLPTRERAGPNKLALGFRGAHVSRIGNIKTVFAKSVHWDASCYPQPEEQFAENSGCGEKYVPWDAAPLDSEGTFYPDVFVFLPTHMLSACPTKSPSSIDTTDSFPTKAKTHIPLNELRDVLGKKNGKLIILGHHRYHTEDTQGEFEVTATTLIDWKMILIRAHPGK